MYAPTIGDPPPGCTCRAYLSVIPPGPCPHHAPPQWVLVPVYPLPSTRWYPTASTFGTITVTSTNSANITLPKSPDNPIA